MSINDLFVNNALLDLWSSINLMPLTMLRQINDLEVKPTMMHLQLADSETSLWCGRICSYKGRQVHISGGFCYLGQERGRGGPFDSR